MVIALRGSLLAALTLVLALVSGHIAERYSLQSLHAAGIQRANAYRNALSTTIFRLEHLPMVLGQQPSVAGLLKTGQGLSQVNAYFSSVSTAANAAVIYLMDTSGTTIASSNWQSPTSFLGQNYQFRHYFKAALAGRSSRQFAIGVTSNRAGYFFARPVFDTDGTNAVLGVVAVKIEFDQLENQWQSGGDLILVSDENGVIVLGSDPAMKFKATRPLSLEDRTRLSEERVFSNAELQMLSLDDGRFATDQVIDLDGKSYVNSSVELAENRWRVTHLAESSQAKAIGLQVGLSVLGLACIGLLTHLFLRERQRKAASERTAAEAAETMKINRRLVSEVNARIATEKNLRDTQRELVLATKMAALGKMSAAVAHEINQPIAAIRTFSSSGRLLINKNRADDAIETLNDIERLTDRIANITSELKLFSQQPGRHPAPVDLHQAIANALKLFTTQLTESHIEVTHSAQAPPLYGFGEADRLEQVLTNLISNAIDAIQTAPASTPRLSIECEADSPSRVRIVVSDNGPGIDPTALDHVFDPFFTTKPTGQGLGLGLAISFAQIEAMGGRLRAQNHATGASFVIELRRAQGLADPPESDDFVVETNSRE